MEQDDGLAVWGPLVIFGPTVAFNQLAGRNGCGVSVCQGGVLCQHAGKPCHCAGIDTQCFVSMPVIFCLFVSAQSILKRFSR